MNNKKNANATANTQATQKPQTTQTTMPLKAATPTSKPSVQMGHTNRRRYYLYAPGKGFVVSAEKGLPTFGVGGDVASYSDMRMVKFVKDFFVNTLKVTDELLVMTVVA